MTLSVNFHTVIAIRPQTSTSINKRISSLSSADSDIHGIPETPANATAGKLANYSNEVYRAEITTPHDETTKSYIATSLSLDYFILYIYSLPDREVHI